MLECFAILLFAFQWMCLLQLHAKYVEDCKRKGSSRRWFVKPHLTNQMRDMFGAYNTIFLYYANYDEEGFVKMVRLTVEQFKKLHEIVAPRLTKTSLRRPLSTELRLALALNYLAHGDSEMTTANFFRVGSSTMYDIISEVCPLIWELLSQVYLRWKSPEEWKIVAQGFRVRWDFPNCVGALDGKEIRIKAPPHSGSLYFNYKKHNFVITEELPLNAWHRRYGIPVRAAENRRDQGEEHLYDDNLPNNFFQIRETLADYFTSPEGELRQ